MKNILWLALLLSTAAIAAPKAQSAGECEIYADVAIVARAMAIDKITEDSRARVLAHIYEDVYAGINDKTRVIEIIAIINKTSSIYPDTARKFAMSLGATCMRFQGDMDAVLGGTGL